MNTREEHHPSQEISDFLQGVQAESRVAPLLVAGVANYAGGLWHLRGGTSAPKPTVSSLAIFDLASITKSIFAYLVAGLVEEGHFSFDTVLRQVLPEVNGTWGGEQTVESLLSHRSGLVAHVELFGPSWAGYPVHYKQALVRAASSVQPRRQKAPVYSDLGYILVGAAVERVTQTALDVLIAERICRPWLLPIGSARAFRRAGLQRFFVSTEVQPSRGGQLSGVVHDDNAWALRGSRMCGHAGLFGRLDGVLRFGCRLLDGVAGRAPQVQRNLPVLLKRRPGSSLRLGLDGVSGPGTSAGALAGPETFGHLGFTGTSLWCDPEQERVTVFLCNRVAPTRDNPRIRAVRPKIHDFLWAC